MRLIGQSIISLKRAFLMGMLLFLGSTFTLRAQAPTAPYVLPYTMTTYAGPHGVFAAGSTICPGFNGTTYALDVPGDGCIAGVPFTGSITAGSPTITNVSNFTQLYAGLTVSGPGMPAVVTISSLSATAQTITLSTNATASISFASFTAGGVNVNEDPHDLRVDGKGNVFYLDNVGASFGVVHKINAFTLQETIAAGSATNTKACSTAASKYGDNCTATDGAANSSSTLYTSEMKLNRGLGMTFNGDFFIAGYNDDLDHKISTVTGLMSVVMGSGETSTGAGSAGDTPSTTGTPGVGIGSSAVNASRGIGADAAGNVYVADTGNDVVKMTYYGGTVNVGFTPAAGNTYTITAQNGAAGGGSGGCTVKYTAATPVNAVPVGQSTVCAPEDVQVDAYGNIFIADAGENLVRVVYHGGAALLPSANTIFFGIPNPVPGDIYTIAGGTATAVAYPKQSTAFPTTIPATASSGSFTDRKLSLDLHGNLYVNDTSNNVVWFIDATTGYMRLLAGEYGGTAGTTSALGCANNPTGAAYSIGDGCPGYLAFIQESNAENTGFGGMPDALGNYYLSDAEGAAANALLQSRIRKLVSGQAFPATTAGMTITQNVDLHFAAGDTPLATGAYSLSETNGDYTLGSASCVASADTTTDCVLPITFTPTISGSDNAVLTVSTTLLAKAPFVITGSGVAPQIAFDPGNLAQLSATVSNPQGIVADSAGNSYIADTGNNRVLFYNAATQTSTVFAGGGSAACLGATDSFGDGCAAASAALNGPKGVALDALGNLMIADTGNNLIRKVNLATGIITLYGGGGTSVCSSPNVVDAFGDGCAATSATFKAPSGLATDNLGNLYIADTGNNLIREISTTGFVSVLAGGAASVCSTTNTDTFGDGCAAAQTTFNAPTGLAFDTVGKNIFVADTGDNIIRKIYLATTFTSTAGTSTAFGQATGIIINPVTLVAGDGQAGTSVGSSDIATQSQLNGPTGIALDYAGNVYIADTGNDALRLVNSASGVITTIGGILGASGSTTVSSSSSATSVEFNSPAAVALAPSGNLVFLDSGNNRVLFDTRTQISYDFGRVNEGFAGPIQNFTEVNVGPSTATLPSPAFTQAAPSNTRFTLVGAANSNGSTSACAAGTFAPGAICNLQGQFTPALTDPTNTSETATFNQAGTGTPGAAPPSITLNAISAILTTTSGVVDQASPTPPTNSQYGASVTLTATITPVSCNSAAPTPSCAPTGTVKIVVDGTAGAPITLTPNSPPTSSSASQTVTGLSVGQHTVSCIYSGDNYYASSTCTTNTITVAQASTTSLLSATNNNQPQYSSTNCSTNTSGQTTCIATTLSASVLSNTSGTPTGTITFYVNGTSVGSAPLGPTGSASFSLSRTLDANGAVVSDTTLPPGSYSLTCTYSGSANFATSNCSAITYVVTPSAVGFTISPRGCAYDQLFINGTSTPGRGVPCGSGVEYWNTIPAQTNPVTFSSIPPTPPYYPELATADGSTADATLFFNVTPTLSGTMTFSCSGLPQYSVCTFSPTSITFTPTTSTVFPPYTDVTLWTDIQPGTTASAAHPGFFGARDGGVRVAVLLGWPLTIVGLIGFTGLRRRRASLRGLALIALLLVMSGSCLIFTGCAGPGVYQPVLTPAGTYPITITVTADGITQTTTVYFKVSSPGIPGQE